MAEYGQFCPVAKAAEILTPRWALLILREMLCGSSRFADLQRGVPTCPPATLAKRLRELAAAGVVRRTASAGDVRYELTEAGRDLYPLIESFGHWGQRWARSTYPDGELDVELLLWDLRRFLVASELGAPTAVVELAIETPDRGRRRFWIVVEHESVDICVVDPQKPVDALIETSVRTLTQVWMGDIPFDEAIANGAARLTGPPRLTSRLPTWIGRHPVLGHIPKAVAESLPGG